MATQFTTTQQQQATPVAGTGALPAPVPGTAPVPTPAQSTQKMADLEQQTEQVAATAGTAATEV